MAASTARLVERRLTSLLDRSLRSQNLLPQGYACCSCLAKGIRGVQTKTETPNIVNKDDKNSKSCQDDSKPVSNSIKTVSAIDEENNIKYRAFSSLKASTRHDLAMIFTCKVCDTRSVKTVCRESYEKGVVVARCGGCNNLHLIADRLGWFGEPGSVEDFLAAQGEEVKKGSVDTLNLTLEDLAGTKSS
ncbi:unnamed protein product [Musa acuminata var. zebrina]